MHFPATSLFLFSLLAATGLASPTFGGKGPNKKVPKGFVYTEGTKFKLDGKDFHFAGSNAYYLPFHNNETDTYLGLKAAKAAGLKVMRTWGFYDLNTTHIPASEGGMPQYGGEGAGPTTVHFQSWTNGKPTINKGKNGLQVFDGVVRAAEKTGVKLVVALTNNWADYGGMDMYTINLLGGNAKHDDFYTSPLVQKHFRAYIKAVVSRYTKSPAILGWQLANEPRCGADGTRNLPRSAGKTCNHTVITKWARETSRYIKSLDPLHLVSTGSEGEFNFPDNEDWAYSSADGGDFYAEVALPDIDYGTFHLYPDWWSKTSAWGTQWIHDHADAQYALNKPVVLEEYGWLSPEKRLEYQNRVANETRSEVIGEWQKAVVQRKLAGDQYWQYGWSGWSYGRNHDDGFTIFSDDAEAKQLIFQHAKDMEKLNKKRK